MHVRGNLASAAKPMSLAIGDERRPVNSAFRKIGRLRSRKKRFAPSKF